MIDTPGSGSLWSRRTRYGTGLMTTAAHVLTPCMQDADCDEKLRAPNAEDGSTRIRLTDPSGVYASAASAHFPIFNLDASADAVGSPSILPRSDASVYAVDSQLFETYGFQRAIVPDPIVDAPLSLHDPDELTKAQPTWANVGADDRVLVMGYAAEPPPEYWPIRLFASVGRILSDGDARQALEMLARLGDEEGSIPYDPEAEFVFEGRAIYGMSGSGVFNERGEQVGILVRGSLTDTTAQYLRGVRMSYVVGRIQAAVDTMSSEQQDAIKPYLETSEAP
jgi:hypothetical protein